MKSRLLPLLGCLVVLGCAGGYLLWSAGQRSARISALTELGSSARPDLQSRTGYARSVRNQVIPELQYASHQWLVQAETAAAEGRWRLRQVDYDNAPAGRETRMAAPYRWWLGLLARSGDTGRGAGLEHAALRAGPWLHLTVLLAATAFVGRRFGAFAGGLVAAGFALLFPLAGAFLPGHPDDPGLKAALVFASVVLVLAGVLAPAAIARRWFVAAGVAGGFGLWVNALAQAPAIAGLAFGGVLAAWRAPSMALPWRAWGLALAGTSLAAWLVEFAPSHLGGWRIESNHPVHAFAGLGLAELLARFAAWRATGQRPSGRGWLAVALAGVVVAAVPISLLASGAHPAPAAAANPGQLTVLGGGIAAESLGGWLGRDGFGAAAWATLAPLAAAATAGWLGFRTPIDSPRRSALLTGLGPVAVLALIGCFQLQAWTLVDGALLALVAAAAGGAVGWPGRALWTIGTAAVLLPGLALLKPPPPKLDAGVQAAEVDALVARDLAHCLATRVPQPGAVVLAPPALSAGLVYYGGLRAVSTPWWENQEGFGAAARIMGATSADEALALVQRRQITHLVLPSWDGALDDYARISGADFDKTLAGLLGQWLPPRWLRPLPYQLPGIAGLEGRQVRVFEVVEAQDNPTALGRLAEYFLETGQPQLAAAVAGSLKQAFPHELAALAARAHVDFARRDGPALTATLGAIDAALGQGADEILPWERRISLALALAQGRRMDQARAMVENCLAGADDERLRSLTPGALYRLLLFCRAAGVDFPEPSQREAALALLPAEWRERL